jgi:hypothetical protein
MEHITYTSCLLAFFGLMAHIYFKYKRRKNKNRPFSLSIWIQENVIETLFSLMFTFCALMFTESILYFMGMPNTDEYKILNVLYFMAGYLNQDIVKKIGNKVKKLNH